MSLVDGPTAPGRWEEGFVSSPLVSRNSPGEVIYRCLLRLGDARIPYILEDRDLQSVHYHVPCLIVEDLFGEWSICLRSLQP